MKKLNDYIIPHSADKADFNTKREKIQERIEMYESRINSSKKKLEKLKPPALEKDFLVPMFNDIINEHFPDRELDILDPHGLRCSRSIWLVRKELVGDDKHKNGNILSIGITHRYELDFALEIFYDTGERRNEYESDSIGALNGFNNVTKKVESIEEIVEFLRKQINT